MTAFVIRNRVVLVLAVAVLIVAVAVSRYLAWRSWASTDDAFLEGRIVQVSSQVPGRVARVNVDENKRVEAGEVLVEIDDRDLKARLEQARAVVAEAEAEARAARSTLEQVRATTGAAIEQARAELAAAHAKVPAAQADEAAAAADLDRARADAARYANLDERAVSRQQRDLVRTGAAAAAARAEAATKKVTAARAEVDAAAGRLAAAEAGPHEISVREAAVERADAAVADARAHVAEAELALSYTRLVAPEAGRVTRKSVQVGNYVQVGQILMALVPDERWVVANFKETQVGGIHAGQPAEIYVDAYPDAVFHAHVDSVQAGAGARFSLLPPENATGNYVKIVQRVPVKIVFDEQPDVDRYNLGIGMSVVPEVRVR